MGPTSSKRRRTASTSGMYRPGGSSAKRKDPIVADGRLQCPALRALAKLLAQGTGPARTLTAALELVDVPDGTRGRMQAALRGHAAASSEPGNDSDDAVLDMAHTVAKAFLATNRGPRTPHVLRKAGSDRSSHERASTRGAFVADEEVPGKGTFSRTSSVSEVRCDSLLFLEEPMNTPMVAETCNTDQAAVSDTEDSAVVEGEAHEVEDDIDVQTFLWRLTEAVQLENATHGVMRKTAFRVYRLNGVIDLSFGNIAHRLQSEVVAAFHEARSSRRYRDCRLYVKRHNGSLWVQIIAGDLGDVSRSTAKAIWRAVVNEQEQFLALSVSGPNGTRFVPAILSALDACLTSSKLRPRTLTQDAVSGHFEHAWKLVGPDPLVLLRSALGLDTKRARHRMRGSIESSNPLIDLQTAATGNLLNAGCADAPGTETGAHKRKHAAIVQHGCTRPVAKKRMSGHGLDQDPRIGKCIRWEIVGRSPAIAVARECGGDAQYPSTTSIRCRFTARGPNIMEGLKNFLDEDVEEELPLYIRDASRIGPTVKVVNGVIVSSPQH